MDQVQQLKDILSFALSLGNTMGKTLDDGKISLAEMPLFLTPLFKLPAAIQGISEVPSELEHLDEAGKAEIYAFVKENFEIADEKVEGAVLDGLKLAGDLHGYVKKYFLKA